MDDLQEFLMYGLAGLFLAGLLAMGITWLYDGLNWWIVAAASTVGFLLCGLFRDGAFRWVGQVLGWLVEFFWWW